MNRLEFRKKVQSIFTHTESMLIMLAYDLSKAAHRTQVRQEFGPETPDVQRRYFNHPKWMAEEMLKDGIKDYGAIIVALLHDCPEDTAIFGNQLTEGYNIAMKDAEFRLTIIFGEQIAKDIVILSMPLVDLNIEVLSTKGKCLAFYKNNMALMASTRALIAKLYDRIHNMKTIQVKSPKTAVMKIVETEEFYIPLFTKRFIEEKTTQTSIGKYRLVELIDLVIKKKNQIESNPMGLKINDVVGIEGTKYRVYGTIKSLKESTAIVFFKQANRVNECAKCGSPLDLSVNAGTGEDECLRSGCGHKHGFETWEEEALISKLIFAPNKFQPKPKPDANN